MLVMMTKLIMSATVHPGKSSTNATDLSSLGNSWGAAHRRWLTGALRLESMAAPFACSSVRTWNLRFATHKGRQLVHW